MAEDAKILTWYELLQNVYKREGSDESLQKINADDILKEILEGKDVDHKNVIIKGDLDLRKIDIQNDTGGKRVVTSEIKIYSCQIQGTLYFSHSLFEKSIIFLGSRFEERASFWGCQFKGYTNFSDSRFKGDANFSDSRFEGNADFSGSRFEEYAYFPFSRFKRGANFSDSQFDGDANFEEARFDGDAFFAESWFKGNANFIRSRFKEYIDFSGSWFKGDANFSRSQFEGEVYFLDRKTNVRFNRSLNLNDCKINSILLENVEFSCLTGKQISLEYPELNYFFASWDSIKDHILYHESTYLALVKNYKSLGWFNDADNCYYAFRKLAQTDKKWYKKPNRLIDLLIEIHRWFILRLEIPIKGTKWVGSLWLFSWIKLFDWSKLLDHISWITCGYGLKIWPLVIWIIGSILIFASIYSMFDGIAINLGTTPGNASLIDCVYFSTFSLAGRPTPVGFSIIGSWKYVALMENLLGYVFLALFVVVLGRKVAR
jgi:hypothetical protein